MDDENSIGSGIANSINDDIGIGGLELHDNVDEGSKDENNGDRIFEFMDFTIGLGEERTLERYKERAKLIPSDMLAKTILERYVLHHYLASYAPCQYEGGRREEGYPPADIRLEVVQYLLELAPDAVNKEDCSDFFDCGAHPRGVGAYPLHLACFNADCPVSVIKLLFEMNPSVAKYSWKENSTRDYGLPLHCYLERAYIHASLGEEDDEGDWIEEYPALPSGELHYDIVKMLVDAHPEAIKYSACHRTPLSVLCNCGYDISLELAKLLVDKDLACFKDYPPCWSLLRNRSMKPFPEDVFCYLYKCNPTAFKRHDPLTDDDSSDDDSLDGDNNVCRETALHVACANPNMTAGTVQLIIKDHSDMVRAEDKEIRCIPLHTLCKNEKLCEQSAIDILKLLISAYPEYVEGRRWYLFMVYGS